MKRLASVCVIAVALLVVAVPSSEAGRSRHGGRARVFVGIGVGPAFWWGPYPYWYYPPPYYYPYYPPPVVVEQPTVYVQQPAPPPTAYWYYCESAKAYYPSVPSCPEAWIRVPPRPAEKTE